MIRARTLVLSVIFTLALMGCDKQFPQFHPVTRTPCVGAVCTIKVTVSGDCSKPSDITVDDPDFQVKNKHQNPNPKPRIVWELQNYPDFEWVPAVPDSVTAGGITFFAKPAPPTPAAPPEKEFKNPKSNGPRYELTDENSPEVETPYQYDIHLQTKHGTRVCAVLDPVIKNGAS